MLTLGFQAVGQTVRDTCGRVGGTGGTCSGGQRENENCCHLILTRAALPFPGGPPFSRYSWGLWGAAGGFKEKVGFGDSASPCWELPR